VLAVAAVSPQSAVTQAHQLAVLVAQATMSQRLLLAVRFTRLAVVVVAATRAAQAVRQSVAQAVPMRLEVPHQRTRAVAVAVLASVQAQVALVLATVAQAALASSM